jgi:hypothetical protein
MLQTLNLETAQDYATFPWLGNTGSVALPITLAMAGVAKFLHCNDETALLGIGSGINSLMLGLKVNDLLVGGELDDVARNALASSCDSQPLSADVGFAKRPHIPLDGYKPTAEPRHSESPKT